MDLSLVTDIIIPNGNVTKIMSGNIPLWEKIEEDVGGLPRSYQKVEWIGNDTSRGNKAYINLDFAFDTKATIEMGQFVEALTTGYAFGATENSGKLRCLLTSPDSGKTNAIAYGSTGSAYITLSGVNLVTNTINELSIAMENGKIRFFNATTASERENTTQGEYTMTNKLYLFAQNYNGTARFSGVSRFSYFRYYDKTNTLICDLIPCYRKSDGVIGMYDVVRGIFLVNVGSGTFEKGADIS